MLEIEKVDSPFHIRELPLTKVYVIDNYLERNVWHFLDEAITNASMWSKTNQVQSNSPTGLPHHSFWGASWFRSDEEGNKISDTDVHKPTMYLADMLDKKIQTDFGFVWKKFQYMGTNSQTYGQHGTTHSDCDEKDDWNLSFLYYYNRYWNPHWGGKLRFYDESQRGLDGRDEHIQNHQIGEVDFVPNRLLMFDGRIPHGADAPNERARYQDRRSIVLRGDEVELCPQ